MGSPTPASSTSDPSDPSDPVVAWLLDADPSIAWQVRRDLLDEPEAQWRAEQARVETEGWGAALLSHQDPDGQWAGGSFVPAGFTRERWAAEGQPWTATGFVLSQLRELGLDPRGERARWTVARLAEGCRWDHDGQPFWEGEVEECINGRLVADGAWYGVDMTPVVDRLLGQVQPDGGWNCDRERGSVVSSFHSTINVLEGLQAWRDAGDDRLRLTEALASGREWLLQRGLFRRLSTGEPANPDLLSLTHPWRWRHDVLRGLEHLRVADVRDERAAEAVDVVRAKRRPDGRWPVERRLPGAVWVDVEPAEGEPSPWVTLLALRALRWWDAPGAHPG